MQSTCVKCTNFDPYGKSVPSANLARGLISSSSSSFNNKHPTSRIIRNNTRTESPAAAALVHRISGGGVRMEAVGGGSTTTTEEEGRSNRTALGEVVGECVRRWFQDTLKEAKTGDSSMQVLLAQMYFSGYGVPKDPHKGRLWINRASKSRSSVWKVGEKHPGYNASDSDSDEIKEDAN